MATQYMLGNEAIAHACCEADLDFASGYPGTPSSEVIDTLRFQKERDFYIEWSVNEKVALENALGASWTGVRCLVTMKHVGLNVAADPLMTSGYTGVRGGLVILSADDPFAHSSQNEQDSRIYAKFAGILCLDPSNLQEAHDMMKQAYGLSEEFSLPVLFRPTTRICHSKSDVKIDKCGQEHRKGSFEKDPSQYVVIPVHTRILHKKLDEKQASLAKRLVESGYNFCEVRGKTAVITSGIAAEYVKEIIPEDVSFAKIGAYPIDSEWLKGFVSKHEKVLVVEELSPVVEEEVRQAAVKTTVFGKKDGCVPYEGELDPERTALAFEKAGFKHSKNYPHPVPAEGLPPRPPILCAGCGHRATFYAMKKVFGKSAVYPSDIGCYTLGIQLGTVDTTICMGASITVGSGISHSGDESDVVCTIGDSTFLHTGIQGLLNAVYNGANMTVVILDNRITAMTGHQPNPNTGLTAKGETSPSISLETICRACGASFVETINPYDLTSMLNTFKSAKSTKGVKVVISRQPCVIASRKQGIKRRHYTVNPDACIGCRACVRFGCPAIEFRDEKSSINELCSGCGVCSDICPKGAIIPEGN
ncbi:indolepyruvate ferredoxin oxidoreductase alpha subunit [Methanomicrobium sp. W14]|uniref:indolepyruvate ferredoxin oxidoreductase subunit alpha n=1 Tax=Methanomicrobium sp. W14 TaxID=2817839 RepID=UPI001AE232A3|nr:indolepyruvate ferredoxin oxidoreductase subunit alpha [Methanomicrobium sp. W14]MBP2134158.1 indolepyruvate ferredoxin oxidoreductase alpha subunit [Methanomicrobium sp. W14]